MKHETGRPLDVGLRGAQPNLRGLNYDGLNVQYNVEGKLLNVILGDGTVNYRYDGLGRRVGKLGRATSVLPFNIQYAYDLDNHLIGEYKEDGTPIREYIWLGDLIVAVIDTNPDGSTTAYAVETDHLGTPRLLTDATQQARWRWTSPPFGDLAPAEDPSGLGKVTFNLRFPGQYYDRESGLFYNWNRFYDAGTGRYVQSDPIGLVGGWNTYTYVGGNPMMFIDPTGLYRSVEQMLGPDGRDIPLPKDYPTTERRPVPPPPPPPPSTPNPDPWPGPDDWRGQCIRLYEICAQQRWTGRCGQCLNKCTAQQEWPFTGPGSCKPRRKKNYCPGPESW